MSGAKLTPAYEAKVLRDALAEDRFLHLSPSQVKRIAKVTARHRSVPASLRPS